MQCIHKHHKQMLVTGMLRRLREQARIWPLQSIVFVCSCSMIKVRIHSGLTNRQTEIKALFWYVPKGV